MLSVPGSWSSSRIPMAIMSCKSVCSRLKPTITRNYAVQYVIDLKIPNANSSPAQQFFKASISTSPFSSNVVEKCLKVFKEVDKAKIIVEILTTPHLEQLLQHPYANYVIYYAVQNSKGSLHSALTNAIRPHVELLRTSPYYKRLYSRALLKK